MKDKQLLDTHPGIRHSNIRYPELSTYITALILSILFDIGSTIANVFKYNDPYLKHEMNFMLQGKYWPWLIANGFVQFVVVYVLFSIGWKNRACLMPNMESITFGKWLNSCLYGEQTGAFEFKMPKWKNVWVFLLLIILIPIPLVHVICGLLNSLVYMGFDVSYVYQFETIFIFAVCIPLSVIIIYLSLDKRPGKSQHSD